MKIAVVSPHRDDAAFSVGLSLRRWLEAGHTVTVVNCFTRSEYAPYAEFEFIHSNDRLPRVSALRLREDERWQTMYRGKLQRIDLNLKDAPLRFRVPVDQVIQQAVNPQDKAMGKIAKGLESLKADALVLPLALGGHVDHRTAREAMLAVWPAERPLAFYEDLPYAAWPGVAEAIPGVAEEANRGLRAQFVTTDDPLDAAVERKRQLALCYDSQIADGVAEQIAVFSRQYGGRERLWGNAAWSATELTTGDVP